MGVTIQSRLQRIAKEVKKWLVDLLSKRAQRRPEGGYYGSTPPEPPRMRSGALRAGIHYRVRQRKSGWVVEFLSKMPYGVPLEKGFQPGGIFADAPYQKPRPFLKPARERAMRLARRELVKTRYSLTDFAAVAATVGLKFPMKFTMKMPFKI